MTEAISSVGCKVLRGAGSPLVYTAVAEVFTIAFDGREREIIDVTHLNSPNEYREKLKSFKNNGTLSFEMNYIPGNASQSILETDFNDGNTHDYRVEFSDAGPETWSFEGIVINLTPTLNTGEQAKMRCSIEINGGITIA